MNEVIKKWQKSYVGEIDSAEEAFERTVLMFVSLGIEGEDPEELAGLVGALSYKAAESDGYVKRFYEDACNEVIQGACETLVDDDCDDFIRWIS